MREQLAARDFIASRRIRTRVTLDILQPVDPLSPKECPINYYSKQYSRWKVQVQKKSKTVLKS